MTQSALALFVAYTTGLLLIAAIAEQVWHQVIRAPHVWHAVSLRKPQNGAFADLQCRISSPIHKSGYGDGTVLYFSINRRRCIIQGALAAAFAPELHEGAQIRVSGQAASGSLVHLTDIQLLVRDRHILFS